MQRTVVLWMLVWGAVTCPAAASFDPAVTRYMDYKVALGSRAPLQGDRRDPWYRQCGRDARLFGAYRGQPRTHRVEMAFSFTCGLFTQAWDAPGPEAHFAIFARQGLQVYQAEVYERDGLSETRRSLCYVDAQGVPQVPIGVLDWSDARGPYRFVGVRGRGELLAEGEQAMTVIAHGREQECYLLICVRGQGDCAIPI